MTLPPHVAEFILLLVATDNHALHITVELFFCGLPQMFLHGGKSTYMLQAATDVFVSFCCYIFPPQITAGKHRILSAGY